MTRSGTFAALLILLLFGSTCCAFAQGNVGQEGTVGSLAAIGTKESSDEIDEFHGPLLVVSMRHALGAYSKMLEAGSTPEDGSRLLGWMTQPLAFFLGEKGDLLLVGERNANQLPITIDDVIVAWRNRNPDNKTSPSIEVEKVPTTNPADKVSASVEWDRKTIEKFATVSLDPLPSSERRYDYFKVKLTGDSMQDSHMGYVFYQADVLLKLLGQGYEAGMRGIPNEFELSRYQLRRGSRFTPLVEDIGSSYNVYFNSNAKTIVDSSFVGLYSFSVLIDSGGYTRFQQELLEAGLKQEVVAELGFSTGVLLSMKDNSVEPTLYRLLTAAASRVKGKCAECGKPEVIRTVFGVARNLRAAYRQSARRTRMPGINEDYIVDFMSVPEASSFLLTKQFDTLKKQYTAFSALEACLRLVVLCKSADKALAIDEDVRRLLASSRYRSVPIPSEIPIASRSDLGVRWNRIDRGGISRTVVEEVSGSDPGMAAAVAPISVTVIREAREGDLSQLLKLINYHKPPAENAVSWLVPLDDNQTEPLELNRDALSLEAHLRDSIPAPKSGLLTDLTLANGRWANWLTRSIPHAPIPTGWNPVTNRDTNYELEGRFVFGNGTYQNLRQDQFFANPPGEAFGVGYDLTCRITLKNRLMISACAPVRFLLATTPASATSAGTTNMGLIAGLQNVSLDANYCLVPASSSGSSLSLAANVTTPLFSEAFKEAEMKNYPFGIKGWNYSIGFQSTRSLDAQMKHSLLFSAFVNKEDFESAGQVGRQTGTNYVVRTEITQSLRKSNLTALGLAYEHVFKGVGTDVDTVELSLYGSSRYSDERSYVGVTRYGDGGYGYYYRMNIPVDSLRFRTSAWR